MTSSSLPLDSDKTFSLENPEINNEEIYLSISLNPRLSFLACRYTMFYPLIFIRCFRYIFPFSLSFGTNIYPQYVPTHRNTPESIISSAKHKKQKQKVLSREVKNFKLLLGVVGPSIKPIIFSPYPFRFFHPSALMPPRIVADMVTSHSFPLSSLI